ncbi:hypothetical protein Tco_0328446 [Tanacetum coccineum]
MCSGTYSFLKVVEPLQIRGLSHDRFRLSVFPVSLSGAVSEWFTTECISAIATWDELVERFTQKFYNLFDLDEEEEADDNEDPDEINDVPKIFRIDDDLFNFDTPLYIAFEEFIRLLKINSDLFTYIQEFKTYDEYEHELNYDETQGLNEQCSDIDGYCNGGELSRMVRERIEGSWGDATPSIMKFCTWLRDSFENFHELGYDVLVKPEECCWKVNTNEICPYTRWDNRLRGPYTNTKPNGTFDRYLDIDRMPEKNYEANNVDEEYVAIKELINHSETNVDTQCAYRELFYKMDDGWLMTRATEFTYGRKYRLHECLLNFMHDLAEMKLTYCNSGVTCEDEAKRRNSKAKKKIFEENRLEDKQPEEKTNTDCLVKEQEKEYHTGWKIKMGNVLDSYNQSSTQQCMRSVVTKYLGIAGIQQQNGLVDETNVTLFAKVKCIFSGYHKSIVGNKLWRLDDITSKVVIDMNMGFNESGKYKKTFISFDVGTGSIQVLHGFEVELASGRDQHLACGLFGYRKDSNEASFPVTVMEKIYAHVSLTFNNTVACEHMEALSTTEAGYMTFTEAWKKEIWLKGLLIELRYELRLVAGIAIGAFVKGGSRTKVPAQVKVDAHRY